jgi:uncharacterized protein (DUF362 family)
MDHEVIIALVDETKAHLVADLFDRSTGSIYLFPLSGRAASQLSDISTGYVSENATTYPPMEVNRLITQIESETKSSPTLTPSRFSKHHDAEGGSSSDVRKRVYTSDRITQDELITAFEYIGRVEALRTAKTVAIKPNLAAGDHYDSGSGTVSNRSDLRALIEVILTLNPATKIYICESDSIGWNFASDKFDNQQYQEFSNEYDTVELVDLTRSEATLIEIKGNYFDHLKLSSKLVNADVVISFAKMKTHHFTTITGAIKNLFGCLPTGEKKYHHPYLNQLLPDLAKAIDPDINILDGNPGLVGDPVSGTPREFNTFLVGSDPLATDTTLAEFFGFDPRQVKHLEIASQSGVGSNSAADIEMNEVIHNDERPKIFESSFDEKAQKIGLELQSRGWMERGHDVVHVSSIQEARYFLWRELKNVVRRSPVGGLAKVVYEKVT